MTAPTPGTVEQDSAESGARHAPLTVNDQDFDQRIREYWQKLLETSDKSDILGIVHVLRHYEYMRGRLHPLPDGSPRLVDLPELARIAKAVDRPDERSYEKVADCVEALRANYSEMCERLRDAVARHNLGLGGEHLDTLVIVALDETKREAAEAIASRDGFAGEAARLSRELKDALDELDHVRRNWRAAESRVSSLEGKIRDNRNWGRRL